MLRLQREVGCLVRLVLQYKCCTVGNMQVLYSSISREVAPRSAMVSSCSLGLLCPSSSSSFSSNTDLSYLETSPSFSLALSGAESYLLVTGTWRGFTYCANIPEAIFISSLMSVFGAEDLARLTTPKSSTTEPGASEITARHDSAPCLFCGLPMAPLDSLPGAGGFCP
jgi:hypothetical protein